MKQYKSDEVSNRVVRRALGLRERASGRETVAVGRMKGGDVEIVAACAWCKGWVDGPPTGDHRISHTICPSCEAEHFPEMEDER